MKIKKLTLTSTDYPELLRLIPDPPQALYVLGSPLLEILQSPAVAIVGSRKVSPYGRDVTARFSSELARRGIVIVSGLAIGVDAIAHQGALDGQGRTLAVMPGGLDAVYPSSHTQLARRILEQGGALLSEYPRGTHPMKHHFIARNRIVSGLTQGLLVAEAAVNSGSLHTARFALEQGREVMAVPGNINSPTSAGANNLIRSGATPVMSPDDVLHALGLAQKIQTTRHAPTSRDPNEQLLLSLLQQGVSDAGELIRKAEMSASLFNQTLTMLEIHGFIRPLGGNQWALK